MIDLKVNADGIANLRRIILIESQQSRKALKNAIRTEAFSLRHTLMQAIRMSTPAPGQHLKDLSLIARTVNRKAGLRTYRPLLRIASGVTYDVDDAGMTMRVGYTRRSPNWTRVAAKKQQEGFTIPVTTKMREFFAWRGSERRAKRTWKSRRTGNPLMLRKSTTRFAVPARPIVEPFWDWQRPQTVARIRNNFRMIMRGQVAPGGVLVSAQEMAGF
jgi:hypothetical protein